LYARVWNASYGEEKLSKLVLPSAGIRNETFPKLAGLPEEW
jgi:hypothetical protein